MNNENEHMFPVTPSDSQTSNLTQKQPIMESTHVNLENVEDFSNVCRTCATITEFVIPIFEGEGLQNNLADKIYKHLPIQMTQQDQLPQVVCYQCASTLLAWHELVKCCVQADEALKTRAAAIEANKEKQKSATPPNEETEIEKDEIKFKEIADFVVLSSETRSGADGARASPAQEATPCPYCGTEQPARAYRAHLVATHLDRLFHCDECDEYVDKKEFFLHMSVHAVQYAENPERKPESARRARRRRKAEERDENANDEIRPRSPTIEKIDPVAMDDRANDVEMAIERRDEFSDHDNAQYSFEPLPESVFKAIEDSQESRTEEIQTSPIPEVQEIEPPIPKKKKKLQKTRTCQICGKVYAASSSYFYHMKHFHRGEREHECVQCGRKFATRGALSAHSSVHGGERNLPCTVCGKQFRVRASLYIHMQSHGAAKTWTCEQCGIAFRWRTHLQRHALRHAPQGDHAHKCAQCTRTFAVRADLLRHARTHAPRTLKCQHCPLQFAQPRYLKVHIRRKHANLSHATTTNEEAK